jgi:hypothetical protein
MEKIGILAPTGCLGYGFPKASLDAAISNFKIDVMGMDAGSMDPGPYYLGAGVSFTKRLMNKRDLSLILPRAREIKVPLIIGSCGGAGGNPHLEWVTDIVREVAAEQGLSITLATISGEINKEYLRNKLQQGKVHTFESGIPLRESDIERSVRLVAQMGVEPIIGALQKGADVILCGRALDPAVFAAEPIRRGIDPGIAYHVGEVISCGAKVATPVGTDSIYALIDSKGFVLEAPNPIKCCSDRLTAAHTFWEKSDPRQLGVPGGELDFSGVSVTQIDKRRVRVTGSRFIEKHPYSVKVEGAASVGFRAICVAGTRDPVMIKEIDSVVEGVIKKVNSDLEGIVSPDAYKIRILQYGKNAVMGRWEPQAEDLPHELGLLIDCVAEDREVVLDVCALVRSAMLHFNYPGRVATAGNLAFPISPSDFPIGETFEFSVYHLMEVDDPYELFPCELETIKGIGR